MQKKIFLSFLLVLALMPSSFITVVYGECDFSSTSTTPGALPPDCKPVGVATTGGTYDVLGIQGWINIILNVVFPIIGLFAVYFIVANGLNMVMHANNETKAKESQKGLTWGVLGLLTTILAYALITSLVRFVYFISA